MSKTESVVFIVDDDTSVRKGLARLLRSAGWNVETFASAQEYLARPAFAGVGCVVLDVRMPGMTGPQLHDHLAARSAPLPIVFLTGHADIHIGVDAMKKGAVDFLMKPVDGGVLLQAIQVAVERHRAGLAQAQELEEFSERLARLSVREREVMEYVIAGCLNKQIADKMGITEKTVKVHRGCVMRKMEVGSVAELVHICETVGVHPRR
jgi:FixJ family two-component response regulator